MERQIKVAAEFFHYPDVREVRIWVRSQQHDDFLTCSAGDVLEHGDIELCFFRCFLVFVCHLQRIDENFDFLDDFGVVEK